MMASLISTKASYPVFFGLIPEFTRFSMQHVTTGIAATDKDHRNLCKSLNSCT